MADFQSTVNDLTARIKGSGVLEVAAYSSAAVIALAASTSDDDSIDWKNVGSIEGLAITENMTATQLQGDNAEEEKYVSEHTVTVAFNQREAILEEVRAIVRGSFDVSGTPVAGSLVAGAEQVVASGAWGYNDPIVIENQNYNLGAVTVNSVAGGTNTTLVAGTDYFVGQDSVGRTVVTIIDSDTITTLSQTMTIDYDYTPYASQTIYTGGKTTLPNFIARISNVDESDGLVRMWFFKGSIDQGLSLTLKSDKEADPVSPNAWSFTFVIDNNIATKGKKLWKYYTERGI
jgi:hypothetical protein